MKIGHFAFAAVAALAIGACAAPTTDTDGAEETGATEDPYLVGGWAPRLTNLVKQPTIYVDVDGPGNYTGAARDTFRAEVSQAIQAWIAPMRIFGPNLNTRVVVTTCSDPAEYSRCFVRKRVFDPETRHWYYDEVAIANPHLRVSLEPGIRGYYDTNAGVIHMDSNEAPPARFQTLLHEVGHAFGLGDTYAEGGWFCDIHHGNYAPTSTSVMCNANFNGLQSDDIAGAQHLYCRAFPADCTRGVLTVEWNKNRGGQDYTNFEITTANYRECYDRCDREAACRAYTYVPPGVQGVNARCWLKNGIPGQSDATGMISGYKP